MGLLQTGRKDESIVAEATESPETEERVIDEQSGQLTCGVRRRRRCQQGGAPLMSLQPGFAAEGTAEAKGTPPRTAARVLAQDGGTARATASLWAACNPALLFTRSEGGRGGAEIRAPPLTIKNELRSNFFSCG